MSPSATGGPPHTRTAPSNGGIPVSTPNGVKASGADGGMSAKSILLHHDDLVAATPDLDIHSPIEKILREGERLAKAADTSLDFRRPDIALQEYVKASIIAAEIIPRHKDFPALQSDRKDLHRAYIGLTKRIKSQDEKFMSVKKMVKDNNTTHGTQPRLVINSFQKLSSSDLESGLVKNLPNEPIANLPSKKKPPPIQPKPDALHGKAVPPTGIHTSTTSQADLATRFARLRSPEASPQTQDPRIRTQPIPIPAISSSRTGPMSPKFGSTIVRPTGPREMPSVPTTMPHPTKISLEINLPELPRTPDAIYSPARGTENAATINLPSSIARNNSYLSSSRKNSAPPISTVGPTPDLVDKTDYFPLAQQADSTTHTRNSLSEQRMVLPTKATLTAEELMGYLSQGSHSMKILLVDLRSREDFNNGHILSQFIICVEPITLRHGISGDELADSMVIAPDVEQKIFELRHTFDLVVFYDQSSDSTSPSIVTEESKKLQDFTNAVYEYGYDKRLKQPPVLLVGGLNAWVDLLGPSSLEMSSSRNILKSTIPNGVKRVRPLDSIAKPRNSQPAFLARQKRYQSRPLSKEEEKMWESTLQEEKENATSAAQGSTSDEIVYARTTEDFMRRYPELPSIQESMVSSLPKTSVHPLEMELASTIPKPPARPPPALPRQRSSGISERGKMISYSHQAPNAPTSITALRQPRGLTGLSNAGTTCYLNSVLQGISATPFLRQMLNSSANLITIPKKAGETTVPPQLLAKCLRNVLGHLWCGQWDFINPQTFREYVNAIHSKVTSTGGEDRRSAFGGALQHDASEFLEYLIDVLDDELNPARNRKSPGDLPHEIVLNMTRLDGTLAEAANRWWSHQMSNQLSVITQNLKGLSCQVLRCSNCHQETRRFVQFNVLNLNLPPKDPSVVLSLKQVIEFNYGKYSPEEDLEPRDCDFCLLPPPGQKKKEKNYRSAKGRSYIVYWPDILVISLKRYIFKMVGEDVETKKLMNPLSFTEEVDFSSCKPQESPVTEVDPRSSCDPIYTVYGCIVHVGSTIQGGHYFAYTRSPDVQSDVPAGNWHRFNDRSVTASNFSETQKPLNRATTTTLFLQRKK